MNVNKKAVSIIEPYTRGETGKVWPRGAFVMLAGAIAQALQDARNEALDEAQQVCLRLERSMTCPTLASHAMTLAANRIADLKAVK